MSKRRKRYSTRRFVALDHVVLNSPAYANLSNTAVRIYLEIKKRYYGVNNGDISLSCREAAAAAQCTPETASKKFKELIEHGFIKISEKGMFTYRHATTWILTCESFNNTPSTRDWQYWKSPTPNPKTEQSTAHWTASTANLTVAH